MNGTEPVQATPEIMNDMAGAAFWAGELSRAPGLIELAAMGFPSAATTG